MQAGKLLGADLFGVVESSPNAKEALGLVVFDAATGARLWDQALAGDGLDKQAASLSAGMRAAVAKWVAGPAKLKTVCFLAVRNADLPSDKNAFCQALVAILERRLVSFDALAVLERKRLELVNQEKDLIQKPAYKVLLASLVLIDLQISRAAQGDGLNVVAFLTDRQGKQIARLSAQSKHTSLTELVEPLLEKIQKALAVSAPARPGDLVREGQRFARESLLLLSHNHYIQALEAAESAVALAPAQPEHAALLSRCLTTVAVFLANPKGMRSIYGGKFLIKVEPDKLKASLRLARRGFEMRADTIDNLRPRDQKSLGSDANINILTTDTQRFFRNHLAFYDPAAFDAEASALRDDLLAAMNRLVMAELRAWADVARADPAAFSRYTSSLLQRFPVLREQAKGPQDFTATTDQLVRSWLKIAERQDIAKIEPGYLVWFLQDLERATLHPFHPEDRDKLIELFQTMAKHPHPIIAVSGRHGQLEIRLQEKQIGEDAGAKEFHQIVADVEKLITTPPTWFNEAYHAACYKFLTGIIDRGALQRRGAVRCADLFALCSFMLDREEIHYELIQQALVDIYSCPKELQKKRFELINRALALADSPRCRFLSKGTETWTKTQLVVALERTIAVQPELSKLTPPPWERVRTLVDFSRPASETRLHAVKVVGNQVYAVACGFEKDRQPFVQVVRVAVPDGKPEFLAKAPVKLPPSQIGGRLSEGSWINFITGLAVGKETAYVATESDGVYAFPLSGGSARRIGTKQGLPTEGATALTVLDETLYVGLKNGYFVAFDPAAEHCTVLASSQRKEKLTPFDDGSAFTIPYLVADAPRRRVLFIIYQGTPSSANRTDGLWEFSAKSQTFTQRINLWRHANLNAGTDSRAGRIVLSGFVGTYLVFFDLESNKASLLSDAYPIGPDLKTPNLEKRRERFDSYPYLCQDGWVWTVRPFGRKSVDGTKREILAPLRTAQQWTINPFQPRWLERIDPGAWILIGDPAALWVVQMKTRPTDSKPTK